VKSYLDSPGVGLEHVDPERRESGYRLFVDENYRSVVLGRLKRDLAGEGLVTSSVLLKPGLVAGKVKGSEEEMKAFSGSQSWFFWGPARVVKKLTDTGKMGCVDNPFVCAARLPVRNGASRPR